jgi:hypothetical protein
METKRFIVHLETNWCGEGREFSAIAEEESDIWEYANQQAYENFESFDGFTSMMSDLFEEPEGEDGEYSEEQLEEGYSQEPGYYSYTIEEFTGDEEEWGWYDLEFDCTELKP